MPQTPRPLDADAIMQMVRDAGQRFQPRPPLPEHPQGGANTAFRTRTVAIQEPETADRPDPENAPEQDQHDVSGDDIAKTAPDPEGFSPSQPATLNLDAIRHEAHEAGHASAMADMAEREAHAWQQGHAEGRAEAEAELDAARRTFVAAAQTMASVDETVLQTLTQAMSHAVIRLASDRAGQTIDADPAPLACRIEGLASRIAHGAAAVELILNPADLEAIRPHLDTFPNLAHGHLRADASLGRGDAVLRAGTISLRDVLADRLTPETAKQGNAA